jgi:uncharacterized protein YjiS (DUF1127 family)
MMAALLWRLRLLPGSGFREVPLRVAARLLEWQERSRQRSMLARLDEHLLRDLGLTRADAEEECGKPFWRR